MPSFHLQKIFSRPLVRQEKVHVSRTTLSIRSVIWHVIRRVYLAQQGIIPSSDRTYIANDFLILKRFKDVLQKLMSLVAAGETKRKKIFEKLKKPLMKLEVSKFFSNYLKVQ